MKKDFHSLNDSSRYRKFCDERNKALEYLLNYYQNQLDQVVEDLKQAVIGGALYLFKLQKGQHVVWSQVFQGAFRLATHRSIEIVTRMRRTCFALAYVGEGEAMARALGKKMQVKLDHQKIQKAVGREAPSGGQMDKRIALGFNRLLRKVVDKLELASLVPEESDSQLVEDLESAFPKVQKVKPLAKRKLIKTKRKVKEATKPTQQIDPLVTGFLDDETWDQLVDDYVAASVPTRGPEDMVTIQTPGKTEERFSWEVEQEMTQDFLNQVRSGQIDAAQENGIQEFMWIAILDNRTDECCTWRHGLTTSEIESALRDHDDGCGKVPPAHFHCRCDLAPVTKEVMDTEPMDLGDFDSWLK